MRVGIDYGLEHEDYEVAEGKLVATRRAASAPSLSEPAAAIRAALEAPLNFPALRYALTPDDHVAIAVDERLPHLAEMLVPILEHILQAGVALKAITLLCPPTSGVHGWREEMPAAFREIALEIHDPKDRKRLSYLAATRKGRRLYLNRTIVDADQLVVLSRRGYDPILGYSGSEGALYPALSDEATRQEFAARLTTDAPDEEPWPARQEATEVAWLLGAPFMVQVIEGAGNDVAHVVAGLANSSAEGQRLLNARWRMAVAESVDLVVAGMSGNPADHQFADLAQALAAATRVVKPRGRIVLLTQANPVLGPGAELLRRTEDPGQALSLLRKELPADMAAAFQWANAAQQATVYLLSRLSGETGEELSTITLDDARQAQKLVNESSKCLFLPDAHKTLAVVE
jgi:nickel-dependent lactate racemase